MVSFSSDCVDRAADEIWTGAYSLSLNIMGGYMIELGSCGVIGETDDTVLKWFGSSLSNALVRPSDGILS